MNERSPLVTAISGRQTLIKPPLSVGLRSGSVILRPGEAVGEHTTEGREEIIIILTGTATIICAGEIFEVKEKQLAYIPPESVHNVINNSTAVVEYVYIVAPV
ncbi:MAG: cupin domain-containing protein [Candidatus Vogelbacteria bacterium]